MPLYDFRCRSCEHIFEKLVRPGGDPLVCPQCQSADLERLVTNFAVSTADRSRAAAATKREKAAAIARQENIVREREINEHRREDH